jgi:SAM-dependent methyltransferase
MTPQQVLETYDEQYAQTYNQQYLFRLDEGLIHKTRFEVAVIRSLTKNVRTWLDVACGTGYFLEHARGNDFISCAGLDLSPAMLNQARMANPRTPFIEADFRSAQPSFESKWQFVSCLWGAYALQTAVIDIEALIGNLACWSTQDGICLMPIFDPKRLAERKRTNRLRAGMSVNEDGTIWSYVEPTGKRHENLISPPVQTMECMFLRHFKHVRLFAYPEGADGGGLVGLIATKSAAPQKVLAGMPQPFLSEISKC